MSSGYNLATNLTTKQYKIMVVLCDGNGLDENGNFIPADLDQLLERVSYKTGKDSMQFSIKALIRHGYVKKGYEKRRNARRVVYTPTKSGKQITGYAPVSYVTPDIDLDYIL
jgi:hypothetical protein